MKKCFKKNNHFGNFNFVDPVMSKVIYFVINQGKTERMLSEFK